MTVARDVAVLMFVAVACRARCGGWRSSSPATSTRRSPRRGGWWWSAPTPTSASVLTRLLRAELLDVEVAYVPRRRTPATRAYRLPAGRRAARRARRGAAQRVPLIRDETGSVIVGAAEWRPAGDAPLLHGEAVVDDAVLFDGDVAGVRIEPTAALPGLRARVTGGRSRRWLTGRAAQLGGIGVSVVRDGVAAPRTGAPLDDLPAHRGLAARPVSRGRSYRPVVSSRERP